MKQNHSSMVWNAVHSAFHHSFLWRWCLLGQPIQSLCKWLNKTAALSVSAGAGNIDDPLLNPQHADVQSKRVVIWLAATYCPTSSTGLMSSAVSLPAGWQQGHLLVDQNNWCDAVICVLDHFHASKWLLENLSWISHMAYWCPYFSQ